MEEDDAPDSVGSTPRALAGLVAIAAKLAPTVLKVLPKLSALTKLTNVRTFQKDASLFVA